MCLRRSSASKPFSSLKRRSVATTSLTKAKGAFSNGGAGQGSSKSRKPSQAQCVRHVATRRCCSRQRLPGSARHAAPTMATAAKMHEGPPRHQSSVQPRPVRRRWRRSGDGRGRMPPARSIPNMWACRGEAAGCRLGAESGRGPPHDVGSGAARSDAGGVRSGVFGASSLTPPQTCGWRRRPTRPDYRAKLRGSEVSGTKSTDTLEILSPFGENGPNVDVFRSRPVDAQPLVTGGGPGGDRTHDPGIMSPLL